MTLAPVPGSRGTAEKRAELSLHSYLTRLIWLCVLPLMLLAAWLAYDSVLDTQASRDREAANLANNFALAMDQRLNARIGALRMLATSPLLDEAARHQDLYTFALGMRPNFGGHVILADPEMHMLFNTRVPFGTVLPPLPKPKGHAAAPTALATGQPAVGDLVFGPVARKPLVAIAVPARRGDKTVFLLLATLEAEQFQERIYQVALPAGWSLSLLDGTGAVIARRAPPGFNPAREVDAAGRFTAPSKVSPWSVVLEIPREPYRAPLLAAAMSLLVLVLGATLVGVIGGLLASRRLGRAVSALAPHPSPHVSDLMITEVEQARARLEVAASARELAESERRRGEEEIRQLNADLERRVLERTAELSAANHELDAFAYAVSHDLRAPLRAMSGFSQALLEDYGDQLQGEARVYLGQIDSASARMSELIDGLLALSRSTRGELRRDAVDLSAMSDLLLAELARGEPERRVALDIEPGLAVRGDARMIEVVLRNLLGNAWKYSAHAAAASIRVYGEENDGARRYCVADNGAGFNMAHAGKLFQPFQRLHRQDEFPGIGIGLATVQRIVHRHGGTIEARGEPGKGATFCFTLADVAKGAA